MMTTKSVHISPGYCTITRRQAAGQGVMDAISDGDPPADGDTDQYYSLRWNNYQDNFKIVFHQFFEQETFVDVSLVCEKQTLHAHKVVLSACSTFFKHILLDNPCKHPVIIMPTEIMYDDLRAILEFIYCGEIDVPESSLQDILHTAETLHIKGLTDLQELCDVRDVNVSDADTKIVNDTTELVFKSETINHVFPEQTNIESPIIVTPKFKSTPFRLRAKRHRPNIHLQKTVHFNTLNPNESVSVQNKSDEDNFSNNAHSQVDEKWTYVDDQHESAENSIFITHDSADDGSSCSPQNRQSNIDNSLNIMGDSIGFLDFAETTDPAAPSATPVMKHLTDDGVLTIETGLKLPTNVVMRRSPEIQSTHRSFQQFQTLKSRGTNKLTTSRSKCLSMAEMKMKLQLKSCSTTCATSSFLPGIPMDAIVIPPKNETTTKGIHIDSKDTKKESGSVTLCSHVDTNIKHESESNVASIVSIENIQMDIYQTESNDDSEIRDFSEDRKELEDDNKQKDYSLNNSSIFAPNTKINTSTPSALGVVLTKDTTPKTWNQSNMDGALEALRSQAMSLTKASLTFGIPSTTLWQRAHRLGIDTPKKEGPSKTWSDDSLNNALEALRNGEISANKASKAFGIPSSTLYKIARREGIRLAAPFNAAPTNWTSEDLERALHSIRAGATSVQKASLEFGIPTGTLYGRCKREGIELSRSNPTPWSEENMTEAIDSVRLGAMSINQAAIHFNLPYSSLYGRFKRGKFDALNSDQHQIDQVSVNSYKFSGHGSSSSFTDVSMIGRTSNEEHPQSSVIYHVDDISLI